MTSTKIAVQSAVWAGMSAPYILADMASDVGIVLADATMLPSIGRLAAGPF